MILSILLSIILYTSAQSRTEPITFLSTGEGLSSHIIQIEKLWGKAILIRRGIEVVDFYSFHYPDIRSVCICDLFIFPQTITCSHSSYDEVNKKHNCILFEIVETWSSQPSYYKMPQNVQRDPFFHFTDVDCIAGFYIDQGILPNSTNANLVIPKFNTLTISKHYYMMLPSLLVDLQLNNHFITLHWRRGDQLQQRCPETTTSLRDIIANDTSVNCHTVEEFINVTKSLFEREKINNVPVLVATNEDSIEVS